MYIVKAESKTDYLEVLMSNAKKHLKTVTGPNNAAKAAQPKARMTSSEAASFLGCSIALIYAMKRQNRLKTGVQEGKLVYFDTKELIQVKNSGEIHPRLRPTTLGVGDLVPSSQPETDVSITVPTNQYNMLAMVLSNQNMTVSNYLVRMVSAAVEEATKSFGTATAIGGGRKSG
jgi:hypothetical protein